MDTNEYDAFVWSKLDPKVKALGPVGVRQWAMAKIAEEYGELSKLDVRHMHGYDIDQAERWKETGDLEFAVSVLCQSMGLSTEFIMQRNIVKLSERGDYATYLADKTLEDRTEKERPE